MIVLEVVVAVIH